MFDTEKFICEVEKRPAIYDNSLEEYSNREVKAKCWEEIGEEMYADWNEITLPIRNKREKELLKKWKSLRDNFVRCHKLVAEKESGKSAAKIKLYGFYPQLRFLSEHVKGSRQMKGRSSGLCKPEPLEADVSHRKRQNRKCAETDDKRLAIRQTTESTFSSPARELTSIISESLSLQREQQSRADKDTYGHQAFLMSFVPVLNCMPLQLAMRTRLDVAELITSAFDASTTGDRPSGEFRRWSQCSMAPSPTSPSSMSTPSNLGHSNDN